jgi:hypothetical protein
MASKVPQIEQSKFNNIDSSSVKILQKVHQILVKLQSPVFNLTQPEINLNKSGNMILCEYRDMPSVQNPRVEIINILKNKFPGSEVLVGKNLNFIVSSSGVDIKLPTSSGSGTLNIKNGGKQIIIKLNPKSSGAKGLKSVSVVVNLKPAGLGITGGDDPLDVNDYIKIPEIIEIVRNKIVDYYDKGGVSKTFLDWSLYYLELLDPLRWNKPSSKQVPWSSTVAKEFPSEFLEVFCPLAYIKAIKTSKTDQLFQISTREKDRISKFFTDAGLNIKTANINSFRIWFPGAGNFPIIDSQIGYFENNKLKIAIPISTKDITKGQPNVIKFTDVFTNSSQPEMWRNSLPNRMPETQRVQTSVAATAVFPINQTAYPLYAIKFIFNPKTYFTPSINSNDKNRILKCIKDLSGISNITENQINHILNHFKKNIKYAYKTDISKIINNQNDLEMAKKLIFSLMKKSDKYKPIAETDDLSRINSILNTSESDWDGIYGQNPGYPFTYQNLVLFFEFVLSKTSVYNFPEGKTNYNLMVEQNYFANNRSLKAKYNNKPVPLGATEVVLVKLKINKSTGVVNIFYDSKASRTRTRYGLRSKNAMNRLSDALGITP